MFYISYSNKECIGRNPLFLNFTPNEHSSSHLSHPWFYFQQFQLPAANPQLKNTKIGSFRNKQFISCKLPMVLSHMMKSLADLPHPARDGHLPIYPGVPSLHHLPALQLSHLLTRITALVFTGLSFYLIMAPKPKRSHAGNSNMPELTFL